MRVHIALGAARAELERRHGHLSGEARQVVLAAIEAGLARVKYEQELVDCPACHRAAVADGATEVTWDSNGDDGYLVATFTPGHLRCAVCDLELDGEDELAQAGVPATIEVADVDPGDFYGDDDI